MANPQAENGHTDIANTIMEALAKTRIPGEARQVLDFILRKTYGWHKKEDAIALSQFVLGTGLKKPIVIRARTKLLHMNLINVIKKDNADGLTYRFNKNFDIWKPLSKKITLAKKIISVVQKDNKSLSKMIPTKETITKETTTKEKSNAHFEELWEKYPRKLGKKLAEEHFKTSVKTEEDLKNITKALDNFLKSSTVKEAIKKGDMKYIPYGSTWFNNYSQDWINPPKTELQEKESDDSSDDDWRKREKERRDKAEAYFNRDRGEKGK